MTGYGFDFGGIKEIWLLLPILELIKLLHDQSVFTGID